LTVSASTQVDKKDRQDSILWEDKSRVGLIDVGSNTVRFVVFDLDGRLPQPVFNERAFCGLGATLGSTGKLSVGSQRLARKTIHRFSSLAKQMRVDHLDIFATAAVRDASNGADLIQAVFEETRREMRVLSGQQEAQHSGLGVLAGIPKAEGLAGDLGGGSLEFAMINRGRIGQTISLPLGTLRLLDMFGDDLQGAEAHIDETLAEAPWLAEALGQELYAVGGTWRSLAKFHMIKEAYPLRILHYYELSGPKAKEFARKVYRENSPQDAVDAGISVKRAQMLPVAALVLHRVTKMIKPSRMIVSSNGLREGILYDKAQRDLRKKDPLIEFCKDTARRQSRFPEHGKDLRRWISPLFENESEDDLRLRRAICLLSDIGWTGHPEYRAEFTMEQIMQRQILGLSHADRAFISLALFVTNGGRVGGDSTALPVSLLHRERVKLAKQIGLALRLGQHISGGTKKLLGRSTLHLSETRVVLSVPERYEYLVGESVRARLKALSVVMGRPGKVDITPAKITGPAATP
jgi:exopolyphosphatase/guanosine-5'-triphosphate,3'-diphosphate pyrophosphatase